MRSTDLTIRAAAAAAALTGLALLTDTAAAQVGPMPVGWYAGGAGTPGGYAIGTDVGRRDGGQALAGGTIRARVEGPDGFGTLQQSVRAGGYRNHRVRLSAFVRTGGVMNGSAGLWMRVDGPAGSASTDYMLGRPIIRTADWARYDVVLDVPRNATGLTFGAFLNGSGQVWLDDVALDTIGRDAALTGGPDLLLPTGTVPEDRRQDARRSRALAVAYRSAPLHPVNLSFTQGTRTTP